MRVAARPGLRAIATGVGLPRTRVSTAERLAALAPDRPVTPARAEHVVESLGVAWRRIAEPDEDAVTLGAAAAAEALADRIPHALFFCSSTAPSWTASGASAIAQALDLPPLLAFDIKAGCSSTLHAIAVAARMLEEGQTALVVGADTWSRASPAADRGAALMLGDAAGALLIEATADPSIGLLGGALCTWPEHRDAVGSAGRLPPTVFPVEPGDFELTGDPRALRLALPAVSDAIRAEALRESASPIDRMLAHAGSPALIARNAEAWAVPCTHHPLRDHGNCGAANILLSWHTVGARPGETWLLHAVAGGVAAGALLWRS